MKIFIINLKRDTQKREHMKNVLDRIDCDYEFFEAINGSDVDTTKFKSSCYRRICWLHSFTFCCLAKNG